MHLLSRFIQVASLGAVAILVCASTVHADIIISQPFSLGGSDTSQNDTSSGGFGNYATTFDDFTLPSNATIAQVNWVGAYFNGSPGGVTGFTVNLYADNGGTPGSLLETNSIAGNAGETSLGADVNGNPIYGYVATLATPFSGAANSTYWMSIVADLPIVSNFGPQWGWEYGTGGNGTAYQSYNGFGNSLSNDLAFTLSSADTPEPGSVALLTGIGVTGVACFRRRNRNRKTSPIVPEGVMASS